MYLYARRLLDDRPAERLLLVVDQFEELFTLCRDEGTRGAFLDNLLYAAGPEPDGPVMVVLTLRADFYALYTQYPRLRGRPGAAATDRRPDGRGLNCARPSSGRPSGLDWRWKRGWSRSCCATSAPKGGRPEPGALPLLSHALLETWKRREGQIMTLAGYRASGGVQGAIAHTAEEVYRDP